MVVRFFLFAFVVVSASLSEPMKSFWSSAQLFITVCLSIFKVTNKLPPDQFFHTAESAEFQTIIPN